MDLGFLSIHINKCLSLFQKQAIVLTTAISEGLTSEKNKTLDSILNIFRISLFMSTKTFTKILIWIALYLYISLVRIWHMLKFSTSWTQLCLSKCLCSLIYFICILFNYFFFIKQTFCALSLLTRELIYLYAEQLYLPPWPCMFC